MRSKIDECNLWRSAAEQNFTKESRMIYVCLKFLCTQKSSSFRCGPQTLCKTNKKEKKMEIKK